MISSIEFKIPKELVESVPQKIGTPKGHLLFQRFGGHKRPRAVLNISPFEDLAFNIKPEDYANYSLKEMKDIIRLFSTRTNLKPRELEIISLSLRTTLSIPTPLNLYYEPQDVIEGIKAYGPMKFFSRNKKEEDYWFKGFQGDDCQLLVHETESKSGLSQYQMLDFEIQFGKEALNEIGPMNLATLTSLHGMYKIVNKYMTEIRKIDSSGFNIVDPIERKCIELLAS